MNDLQIEEVRSALIAYKNSQGDNGRALPWKAVINRILMSQKTAHHYPEDGSEPEFREEALRRFAKAMSLPTPDKLEDIKAFLVEKRYLSQAALNNARDDIDEFMPVLGYMANQDGAAKDKLYLAQGTYSYERKEGNITERSTLSLKLDDSVPFLRATDELEIIVDEKSADPDSGMTLPVQACLKRLVGYGFVITEHNILHVYLRGESRSDSCLYLEVYLPHLSPGFSLSLHRYGVNDLASAQADHPDLQQLYVNYDVERDEVFEKKMQGRYDRTGMTERVTPRPELDTLEIKLITAARRCDANAIKAWLDAGADINYQDDEGMSALHYAAAYRARPCLRVLLKDGRANYLLKNNNGHYASDLAIIWGRDYAVSTLLNKKQALQAPGRHP